MAAAVGAVIAAWATLRARRKQDGVISVFDVTVMDAETVLAERGRARPGRTGPGAPGPGHRRT
ncbi:hypothetical protein [Streptomyces sp. NPDC055134]